MLEIALEEGNSPFRSLILILVVEEGLDGPSGVDDLGDKSSESSSSELD